MAGHADFCLISSEISWPCFMIRHIALEYDRLTQQVPHRQPSACSCEHTRSCSLNRSCHGVQRRMISVDFFFCILEIIIFCFYVAICDLVHDVETSIHLSYVLTASENLF